MAIKAEPERLSDGRNIDQEAYRSQTGDIAVRREPTVDEFTGIVVQTPALLIPIGSRYTRS